MRREPPVRIREGLGVKLPRATRHSALLFVRAPDAAEFHVNLANLSGVLGITSEGLAVDQQVAAALRWLDDHPGGC
jgi:hypothetical protein